MPNFRLFATVGLFWALLATQVSAAPERVDLAPIRHADARLEIRLPNGEVKIYSPADLENFPTYSLVTTTPWRDTPANFTGILLTDLLAAHGLLTSDSFRVIAENEYTSEFKREHWEAAPFLLATRVDGRAHSRRARGPLQLVVADALYEASEVLTESNLVWSVAVIDATD